MVNFEEGDFFFGHMGQQQQMDNLMVVVERAIQLGLPVLLQDVMEEIDPSLEPILTKAFVYRSGKVGVSKPPL
jgi:hypothetical protein